MFMLGDIPCCSPCIMMAEEYLSSMWSLPPTDIVGTMYWDAIDGGESAQESTLKEEQNKCGYYSRFADKHPLMTIRTKPLNPEVPIQWDIRAPLRVRFSVLGDWATALHTHHVKDVVHGNLTQESVGVVHGRGILNSRQGWSPDDDVYSARWAATELFRIDKGNIPPTKMSDVYSFACLMLQMLTGDLPYCGTKRSEQVVYLKYLGREPIDARTPKIADRYVAFMRWCWSPEPEKRPTMEAVVGFIHEEIKRLGDRADQNESVR